MKLHSVLSRFEELPVSEFLMYLKVPNSALSIFLGPQTPGVAMPSAATESTSVKETASKALRIRTVW